MKMCINTNLGSLTPDLFLEAIPLVSQLRCPVKLSLAFGVMQEVNSTGEVPRNRLIRFFPTYGSCIELDSHELSRFT